MRVLRQQLQVSNTVERRPRSEFVRERQAGQGGVPSGAAAIDAQALGVHLTEVHQVQRCVGAVLDVGDAPGAPQPARKD